MNTDSIHAGGRVSVSPPATLVEVVLDQRLQPLLLALCDCTVSKLRIPGALYFTYPLEGDEVCAASEDIDVICATVANTLGLGALKLTPQVLPHLEAQETLVFDEDIRASILREIANSFASRETHSRTRMEELVETLGVLFAKIKQIAAEQPARHLISPAAIERIEQILAPDPRPLTDVFGASGAGSVDRSRPYMLDGAERDAVLAGLRLLQLEVDNPDDTGWFGEDLQAVYTNDGAHQGLDSTEIDALCERLNF